ncbi:MAG TPA: hypothetical protein VKU19_21940 [Bryobacteraceae bacterium]|nr:hypothetical protein [Bryobacteraceae bacterium]
MTPAPLLTQSSGGINRDTGATPGFLFVGGHRKLTANLDRLGNLWICDDTSDGRANCTGCVWYISAGALTTIP